MLCTQNAWEHTQVIMMSTYIHFLDTLLQRKDDGSVDVTVYRKPTLTDQYLNFTTPPMFKEVRSGACMTELDVSSARSTTYGKRKTCFSHPFCLVKKSQFSNTFSSHVTKHALSWQRIMPRGISLRAFHLRA